MNDRLVQIVKDLDAEGAFDLAARRVGAAVAMDEEAATRLANLLAERLASDTDAAFDTFVGVARRYNDLRAVVEHADNRIAAAEGEYPAVSEGGVVEYYVLRAAEWNRIVAVARGHVSEAAQRVIDSVVLAADPDGAAVAPDTSHA